MGRWTDDDFIEAHDNIRGMQERLRVAEKERNRELLARFGAEYDGLVEEVVSSVTTRTPRRGAIIDVKPWWGEGGTPSTTRPRVTVRRVLKDGSDGEKCDFFDWRSI